MSDIDFDELDRAVNGALNGEPVSRPTSEPSSAPEPTESPLIAPVERTRMNPTEQHVAPRPAAPAARRSSGRFMDVIHPSSDMRTNTNTTAAPAPIVNKPEVAPVVPTEPETPSWTEPLESPFLPDAKVEKRPLGGVATPEPEPAPFDFQGLLDEPEEELLEAPEPQERLEATTTMPDPIDFAQPKTEVADVPEEVAVESVEQEPAVEKPPAEQPAPQPIEEPVGPTSITQQYKEQPSSTQQSGAIYDTESYHQPVSHVPGKKPSWFIIVWIILLVLLGAGAGWAVYTFVLPML